MGTGRSEVMTVQVEVPIYTFREHLTRFSNVKSFTFFTLDLEYQVRRFAVSKGGDGISKGLVNYWVRMWMGQVLQRAQLQGRDPLGVVGGQRRRIWRKLGGLRKWMVF